MRIPRLARALLAFIALPGVVAFVAPLLLGWHEMQRGFAWNLAIGPLLGGAGLLLWCVRDFYAAGKGTLAPWDPPRHLVTGGLYRYSRNPMYLAVSLVLIGWALGCRSAALWLYALIVTLAFQVRVVGGEEPWLAVTYRKEWEAYARRTPRWMFSSRRSLLLSLAGGAATLALAGLVYEAYADARGAQRFPAPGQLVDIGGHRLHLVCIGSGEPVVIFEASSFGNALSSARARERVATRTQACSYDRAGMGWSDATTGAATSAGLARELAVLQDRARLPQPFILVAASIGGLTAEMFARQYPERAAGLVFVDAASSDLFTAAQPWLRRGRTVACGARIMAWFGMIRLLDPFGLGRDGSEDEARAAALAYGARPWGAICAIVRGLPASQREFTDAPPLRADIPLVVLSADSDRDLMPGMAQVVSGLRSERLDAQQALARRSSRAVWRLVPDSTHLIGNSQPDAVADAVFEVLEQIR